VTALVTAVHSEVLDLLGADPVPDPFALVDAVVTRREPLLGPAARRQVVDDVLARISGLGALETLFADRSVTEVMVNGPDAVYVERQGVLERTEVRLETAELDRLVERVVAPTGRRVDRSSPWADGRLLDGSRVNVVVPPIAVDGPCITIRRFGSVRFGIDDMASPAVATLLHHIVQLRCNVVVSGGTGSGKTTLLGALAGAVDPAERLVSVEDAAELSLDATHVVRLEARPPNCEGVGEVTVRDLVRNSLRMRPDRIIVGEVRGAEAFDMLQALNTGHDGSLSTCHANSADDALQRLANMVLLAVPGLPATVAETMVAGSVDLIVHMTRTGVSRGVSDVLEVRPVGESPACRPLVSDGVVLDAGEPSDGRRWGR
jgi:pilus assembly protein CpaF